MAPFMNKSPHAIIVIFHHFQRFRSTATHAGGELSIDRSDTGEVAAKVAPSVAIDVAYPDLDPIDAQTSPRTRRATMSTEPWTTG